MPSDQTPHTHFYPEVNSNPDFPAMEEAVLAFWEKENLFRRSVDARPASKGSATNEFIFYDGPPFANGLPHYGHLLTGYVKDLFARYQTMKGKRVERRFGWDCHGLPAEMGAEKELGISGRQAIIQYGIGKFNEHCRTSVMKYTNEWQHYVTRQARWVDFQNDYKTMDITFMESVLWAFKQMYDKGLVFEAYRVMPYSWAAETPLSNFETRLDNSYREREDKAVTVAFELNTPPPGAPHADKYYVLAWTTTPWTLPSNLALAVNRETEYGFIASRDGKGNCYILSLKATANYSPEVLLKLGLGKENTDLLATIKGSDLLGLSYHPLFPYFASHKHAFRILDGSDFVTDADGTGIVHMAPGFGEDDQRVCEANGIELVCPVDGEGRFTDEIYDIPFPGLEQPPLPLRERVGERGYGGAALENAKDLRGNMTDVEATLWKHLRAKRFESFKFRRQQPIGNYIVDFFCPSAGLIIELDGGQHDAQRNYDEKRTEFLQQQGYKVLRFWNNDMVENLEGVLDTIYRTLGENPSPRPSPSRGEGEVLSLKGLNVIAENIEKFKFGEANERIIDYLKKNGQLIKQETIKHNYPHCWRTDQPLIYRAVPSWYVEVTKFRERMVELNRQINWVPEHIRDGLFGKWLENARDWSISRNRFWGTPIPVWRSDNPKNKELYVFGSITELEAFFGAKITDLHRPYIDDLTKPDPYDAKYTLKRVEDVFDCWFESGSMPYGQVHYPFENKDWFEHHFPADFIVEYQAQTRGWFYTLMVLSTALFDKPPFLNCICHGVVLDDKGQKLSKRLNNYADPNELFAKFGADALRWFMMSSPVMRGNEMYIDKEGKFIRDVVRLAIKPIWNAYNFFCLYANADGVRAEYSTASRDIMDSYILQKCADAVHTIRVSLDEYNTPTACDAITQFFDALNNWYIRRSKARFWKEEMDNDKQTAYNTLYTVLNVICRAAAPLLPLTLEEIYRGLTKEMSVHLANFPQDFVEDIEGNNVDGINLLYGMERVRSICNTALSVRNTQNIRVRQPLASLTLVTRQQNAKRPGEDLNHHTALRDLVEDEVNVKAVLFESDFDKVATLKLSINNHILGKRLPEKMKQIIPASKKGEWKQLPDGGVEICGEALQPGEYTLQLEPKPEYKDRAQALSTNDALVILDTTITPELEAEGIARDLVRMIQQARKELAFDVSDRVRLHIDASERIAQVVNTFGDYIKEQTLAVEITGKKSATAKTWAANDMDEKAISISLERAA